MPAVPPPGSGERRAASGEGAGGGAAAMPVEWQLGHALQADGGRRAAAGGRKRARKGCGGRRH